jgi:hypothetical protein
MRPELFVHAGFAIFATAAAVCGGVLLGYAFAAKRYWFAAPAILLILGSGVLLLDGVVLQWLIARVQPS